MNPLRLTLLALPLLVSTTAFPSQAKVDALGEVAKHRFRQSPINALGIGELQDLRGKPILVAFWGHKSWAEDWVDDVLRLQREHGDDLAVILIDRQGAKRPTIESVALKKGWLTSRALWTTEPVVSTADSGFPKYALLSAEGKVIKTGGDRRDRHELHQPPVGGAGGRRSCRG